MSERRRYFGYIADSDRWDAVRLRADDIIISTPSKCGTTWTQAIVAMLVLRTADLPAPLSELSPWIDMQVRSTDQLVESIEAQQHRRFFKTHTPLDGIPDDPSVTYLAVFRHPLDVALSDLGHAHNTADEIFRLRDAAVGEKDLDRLPAKPPRPDDPGDHLRQFIEVDTEPTGSGPYSLSDMCEQLHIAWSRRTDPNVHLIHYADLCADLEGEMRRIAAALDVDIDEGTWAELVQAASFEAMRAQAHRLAPDATLGIWRSPTDFFAQGGTRNWQELLTVDEQLAFERRLDDLAGPAADWLRYGRRALA